MNETQHWQPYFQAFVDAHKERVVIDDLMAFRNWIMSKHYAFRKENGLPVDRCQYTDAQMQGFLNFISP